MSECVCVCVGGLVDFECVCGWGRCVSGWELVSEWETECVCVCVCALCVWSE